MSAATSGSCASRSKVSVGTAAAAVVVASSFDAVSVGKCSVDLFRVLLSRDGDDGDEAFALVFVCFIVVVIIVGLGL